MTGWIVTYPVFSYIDPVYQATVKNCKDLQDSFLPTVLTDSSSIIAIPHFAEALSIQLDRTTDLFGMGCSFIQLVMTEL